MPSSRKRREEHLFFTDDSSSYGENPRASTSTSEIPIRKKIKKEPENPTEDRDQKPKAEAASTLYDDIVFVKIGAAQTRFGIHRTLLTKASTFFQEILRPDFKSEAEDVIVAREGDSTVVLLTEESAETFARVNSWLYSGKILTPPETWKDVPWNHLIAIYLFSVERGITRLHNKCIDAAIQKTKDGGLFPSQMTVNALYKLDFRAAPLRKLIVKLFAVRCDLRSAILSNSNYHQTFLNSLVIELYDMQKGEIKSEEVNVWASRATYYTHGSENPICVD